ncbi:hypothetical protein [Bradyrhizobium sp. JYMT SZCCT0428]|uniref:TRAFAC clade GTPase domain-containing protein n=1 Tax=Bradyrhizobium sp. JYMT SZCCT0428 TaxID=2807673 RepID=UPI001BA8CE33|nr:hypothetical protein [Bradyrhizobium sp. JYMT SZCCT0428]MBR1154616.1 hypothetical protein [Bradyrhizobium sp. JYMT SZCCT0428]
MDARYMVFGFTRTGKTTFAAALWHQVDSEEIPTVLTKGKHAGQFAYVAEISEAWAEGFEVERTTVTQVENIRINLLDSGSASKVALEFDDLSGETFEQAFATRLCPEKFVELVKGARGMLLFVSADRHNDDAVTILDAFDAEEDETQAVADPNDWDGTKTPLQVQLVDLLQCLQRAPFSMVPMRVAVIVSAWDLVPQDETDPARWLEKRYPLLSQYLGNSEGATDVRIYGVSAQGGKLSKKGNGPGPDRERLLATMPASKRVKVVGPETTEHDITRPLMWLAGLETAS